MRADKRIFRCFRVASALSGIVSCLLVTASQAGPHNYDYSLPISDSNPAAPKVTDGAAAQPEIYRTDHAVRFEEDMPSHAGLEIIPAPLPSRDSKFAGRASPFSLGSEPEGAEQRLEVSAPPAVETRAVALEPVPAPAPKPTVTRHAAPVMSAAIPIPATAPVHEVDSLAEPPPALVHPADVPAAPPASVTPPAHLAAAVPGTVPGTASQPFAPRSIKDILAEEPSAPQQPVPPARIQAPASPPAENIAVKPAPAGQMRISDVLPTEEADAPAASVQPLPSSPAVVRPDAPRAGSDTLPSLDAVSSASPAPAGLEEALPDLAPVKTLP